MRLILAKGKYAFADREMVFVVEKDVFLDLKNCFYFVTGDNGSGKTSFIELILMPLLKKEGINYAYIGQDLKNQMNTIRSSLAFVCEAVKMKRMENFLQKWFLEMDCADVLLLDEFDKYEYNLSQLCDKKFAAYFVITHNGRGSYVCGNFKIKNIEIKICENDSRKIQLL